MKIAKFSNRSSWLMVNLDNLLFAEPAAQDGTVKLHLPDGKTLLVKESEFIDAVSEGGSDGLDWRALVRRLTDSIDRLCSNIPHSVRIHY